MASAEEVKDIAQKPLIDQSPQDVREIRAVTQYTRKKENQMKVLTDKVDGTGATAEEVKDIAQKRLTDLLPQDVKEIRAVTQYAEKKENKMKELTDKVDGMGWLRRIWDSKVPDVNFRFYHFFALTQSNREDIKKDIKVYMDFYKEMSEVTSKIIGEQKDKEDKNGEEKDTMNENENVLLLVLELNTRLGELYKAAEEGKKNTGSSTVYDLHKEFISKHRKLEHMIKKAECVSLKQSKNQTIIELQEANKSIYGLKKDLVASQRRTDALCDKSEEILNLNEELKIRQIAMTEEAASSSENLEELRERNESLENRIKMLTQVTENLAKENMKHRNKIDQQ